MNSDERRERILEAAERLFRHYGPGKTTIGDIAREVGIGVGSVYLEFCSKADIVSELAGKRHNRIVGAMRTAARSGSYAMRLRAALEARIEALFDVAAQGAHSCDLVACSAGKARTLGRFHDDERRVVADLLEEGKRAGEFAVDDCAFIADIIERAYASFSPPALFSENRKEVLKVVRALNQLLLDGLCVRSRGAR